MGDKDIFIASPKIALANSNILLMEYSELRITDVRGENALSWESVHVHVNFLPCVLSGQSRRN